MIPFIFSNPSTFILLRGILLCKWDSIAWKLKEVVSILDDYDRFLIVWQILIWVCDSIHSFSFSPSCVKSFVRKSRSLTLMSLNKRRSKSAFERLFMSQTNIEFQSGLCVKQSERRKLKSASTKVYSFSLALFLSHKEVTWGFEIQTQPVLTQKGRTSFRRERKQLRQEREIEDWHTY
jgi:hypothetical protein